MNTDSGGMEEDELSRVVIGCAFRVSNALGVGFLEKVYENSMVIELRRAGVFVEQQKHLEVYYEGIRVGEYAADLLVENHLLVELKTAQAIAHAHEAQLLNYLRATNLHLGLILNFGTPKLGIRRKIF